MTDTIEQPTPKMRRDMPGLGTDAHSVRQRVEALEKIMERLFVIPGTKRTVGLDVILDLVPFAGSTAGAVLGAYMAWEARNLGMSKTAMARMAGNVGVDWALGLISSTRSRNRSSWKSAIPASRGWGGPCV